MDIVILGKNNHSVSSTAVKRDLNRIISKWQMHGVGIIGAGDKRHLQQLLFPFSFVGNGGNILTRWQEDNKNLERRGKGNLWKCEHTWYLSLFYTTAIWGQEILHLKVRKFATKQCKVTSQSSNSHFLQDHIDCSGEERDIWLLLPEPITLCVKFYTVWKVLNCVKTNNTLCNIIHCV